jgi:hypothetical protein
MVCADDLSVDCVSSDAISRKQSDAHGGRVFDSTTPTTSLGLNPTAVHEHDFYFGATELTYNIRAVADISELLNMSSDPVGHDGGVNGAVLGREPFELRRPFEAAGDTPSTGQTKLTTGKLR